MGSDLLPWFCSVGDCCVFAGVGVLYVVVCCFLLYMLVFFGCFVGAECCCFVVVCEYFCAYACMIFYVCRWGVVCWFSSVGPGGFNREVRKCEWGAGVKCNQISNPQVGISINGVTQNVWFIMEDPIEMDDDWGYPHDLVVCGYIIPIFLRYSTLCFTLRILRFQRP